MADPLSDRWQCENWLIGLDSQALIQQAEARIDYLNQLYRAGIQPTVLLAEPDPLDFIAGLIAARTTQCPLFLGNPRWALAEWQQVFALAHPDVIWAPADCLAAQRDRPIPAPPPCRDWIMIPTGGSSGQLRFAIHTWETLAASVAGFQHYFQVEAVHSFCVLPLYHVSGLMQLLRSLLSGGTFTHFVWSPSERAIAPAILPPMPFFLSLVPTQLQRSLQRPSWRDWLTHVPTVLLGGAPAWDELLAMARQHRIRLAPTYGMTETASQVATLKPDEFLAGKTGCGPCLPHAHITIGDTPSPPDGHQPGVITVQAQSLALGYYPHLAADSSRFITDDVGYLDEQGYLHVVGRTSQKIITGGENVFPAEVEAAIQATGLVQDVCIVGASDPVWGQVVTAVYVPIHEQITETELEGAIASELSPYKRPKRWIAMTAIPRNAQGKVNYALLQTLTSSQ